MQPRACAVPPDSNVAVQSSRGKQGWLPDRGCGDRLHALGYGSFRLGPISGCDLRLAQPSRCDGPAWRGHRAGACATGGGTARPSSGDQLSYIAYPAISGISPQSGPSAGGTRATVHGLGLTGAQLVRVGYSPATNLNVEPNGDLVITVPPGQKGTVDVTVTTPLGTSTPAPHDRFTYVKQLLQGTNAPAPGNGPSLRGTSGLRREYAAYAAGAPPVPRAWVPGLEPKK